jgi:hypothetical protein
MSPSLPRYLHSLAIKEDGTLWAWETILTGSSVTALGQINNTVKIMNNVISVSAGYDTLCHKVEMAALGLG